MPNIPYLVKIPVISVSKGIIAPDVNALTSPGDTPYSVVKYTPEYGARRSWPHPHIVGGMLEDGTKIVFSHRSNRFKCGAGIKRCLIASEYDNGFIYVSSVDTMELFRLISQAEPSHRAVLSAHLLNIDKELVLHHGFGGSIMSRWLGSLLRLTDQYIGPEVLDGVIVDHTLEHANAYLSKCFDFAMIYYLDPPEQELLVNIAAMTALELGLIVRRPGLKTNLH